jgi:hypothetical protein
LSSGSSIIGIRRLGCVGNNDGENGCNEDCSWIFSLRLYVGERCFVCWLEVIFESGFRFRDGSVFERWWDADDVGWYKTSVLIWISNGRSSLLWYDDEGFSISNVRKGDVEPTTDDNDEPLIISIGLTRFKNIKLIYEKQ